MKAARVLFGYKPVVRELANALNDYHLGQGNHKRLYAAVIEARRLYLHYETEIPNDVINLDHLHLNSRDLYAIGQRVYRHMLEQPPANSKELGQGGIAREIARHTARGPGTSYSNAVNTCRRGLGVVKKVLGTVFKPIAPRKSPVPIPD